MEIIEISIIMYKLKDVNWKKMKKQLSGAALAGTLLFSCGGGGGSSG